MRRWVRAIGNADVQFASLCTIPIYAILTAGTLLAKAYANEPNVIFGKSISLLRRPSELT